MTSAPRRRRLHEPRLRLPSYPMAVRAPRRAVGLRGEPARVLDAEGEPRVPRRAWVDARATSSCSRCSSRSCRRSLVVLVEAVSGSSGHCSPARSTSSPSGASGSSRPSSSSGCSSRSGRCAPPADAARGGSGVAYMRWNAFRSVLSFSLVLPVLGRLLFVATVPLAVEDRRRRRRRRPRADAGRRSCSTSSR